MSWKIRDFGNRVSLSIADYSGIGGDYIALLQERAQTNYYATLPKELFNPSMRVRKEPTCCCVCGKTIGPRHQYCIDCFHKQKADAHILRKIESHTCPVCGGYKCDSGKVCKSCSNSKNSKTEK